MNNIRTRTLAAAGLFVMGLGIEGVVCIVCRCGPENSCERREYRYDDWVDKFRKKNISGRWSAGEIMRMLSVIKV